MANGFEGISLEVVGIQLFAPQLGYQGVSVEAITGQYFAPQFGFQGIVMEFPEDLPDPLKKITKHF